jgi:hypothetical protein
MSLEETTAAGDWVMTVSGTEVSTSQEKLASGPTRPVAASRARTLRVCMPSDNPWRVWFALQAMNGAPFNLHSNTTPLLLLAKVKFAVAELDSCGGCWVMKTEGGVVWMSQEYVAGDGSTLPATSRARTASRCVPSPGAKNVKGEEQEVKAAPSRLHSNAPDSEDAKANSASREPLTAGGEDTMRVSGGTVSTKKVTPGAGGL